MLATMNTFTFFNLKDVSSIVENYIYISRVVGDLPKRVTGVEGSYPSLSRSVSRLKSTVEDLTSGVAGVEGKSSDNTRVNGQHHYDVGGFGKGVC